MSYTPKLSDITSQAKASYTPKLEDLAIDNPLPTGKETLKKLGFNLPRNAEERAAQQSTTNEALLGGAQSVANYPIKIANLLRKNKINEFDFAPKTPAAEKGAIAGDIASFFLPGGAVGAGLKGLSYVPKVGKALNMAENAIKSRPLVNSIAKIGNLASQSALFSAAHNPENAGQAAAVGAGTGGAVQAGVNLLTNQNPLLRTLARLGLGYQAGSLFGHGAEGAAVGLAFPQVAAALGVTNKNKIAQTQLEGLNPRDFNRALLANQRLGTTVTPAQASGNYPLASLEGDLKRTPQGAQYAYRQEMNQTREQSNAIQKMLDNIYQPTAANEANINRLYTEANKRNINPGVVKLTRRNAVIDSAFKTVKSDPAFSNIPVNNYKFLAEVSRQLGRDFRSAQSSHPNSAHVIKNSKQQFDGFLKNANPAYEKATKAAQPKIVRRNVEEKFNKNEEDFTGPNFYRKFLNAKKPYREILKETANFPVAQQAIKDMRTGWKHLSNIKTVSQSEAQSKVGLSHARDQFKAILEHLKKLAGANNDVAGLKFIYSKDWDKSFETIMKIKDQQARNRELLSLIGKIGVANGLDVNPSEQK